MAELGALSLRLEATGGQEVLAQLNAIDSRAKTLASGADRAVVGLRSVGVAAKALGGQVVVASKDLERARAELAKVGNTAQVVSKEQVAAARAEVAANKAREQGVKEYIASLTQGVTVEKTRAAALAQLVALERALQQQAKQTTLTYAEQVQVGRLLAQVQGAIATGMRAQVGPAAAVASSGLTIFGREAVTATGRLSSFSTRTIGGLNAAAFALSSFAATGTASFRSLASAASGFAAFFGPGGAIASIAITAGLAISDFFLRTRREIAQTKDAAAKALRGLQDDIDEQRRRGDAEGLVERARLATLRLRDARNELAEANARLAPYDANLARLALLPGARAALAAKETEEIKRLRERRTELERLIPLHEREIALAKSAALRPDQQPTPTQPTRVLAAATQDAAEAEKERQRALSATIGALTSLAELQRLSVGDLAALQAAYRALDEEVKRGNVTLERRAQIEREKAAIAAAPVVQPVRVVPITETARAPQPKPAERITIPPQIAAQLTAVRTGVDAELQKLQESLAGSLANAIASGVVMGFADGLAQGGIGQGFKQMGAELLTGMGSVLLQVGANALKAAILAQGWFTALMSNPWAAAAAAVAMITLGSALGGRKRTVGGGYAGGSGVASETTPINISRIVRDPNRPGYPAATLPRIPSGQLSPAPVGPSWGRPLVVTSPEGARVLTAATNAGMRRGIG